MAPVYIYTLKLGRHEFSAEEIKEATTSQQSLEEVVLVQCTVVVKVLNTVCSTY